MKSVNIRPAPLIVKITSLVLLVLITGCKENSVEPEIKNPGYQEDIQWPSLATTAWPYYHHDPQNSGRSPFIGPSQGIIQTTILSPNLQTSTIITHGSNLSFATSYPGKIFLTDFNGNIKWEYPFGFETTTTPLITADSLIISANNSGEVIALTSQGNLKWSYKAQSEIYNNSLGIGKDGNIFFIDNRSTLYSLKKSGELAWSVNDPRFALGVKVSPVFSPDGKTIYLNGNNILVIAVDAANGNIKWTWGEGKMLNAPVVDSQGNLYLQPFSNSTDEINFYSISSSGTLRWNFNYITEFSEIYHNEPALDKNGNIYFGYDTLYSVNYEGKLNWKYGFHKNDKEIITSPLICDHNCNIYLGVSGLAKSKIISINKSGTKTWEVVLSENQYPGSSPAISEDGLLIYPLWNSNSILTIK